MVALDRGTSNRVLRVLFAGGGTGGHLYPGIALALALQEGDDPADSLFLCSNRGLDEREARRYGFPAEPVPAMRWRGLRSLPAVALGMAAGMAKTAWLLARRGSLPSITVGLGGYASFAPALLTRLLGRPVVLLEQNVVPGRANRILSRLATRVYAQWEESLTRFPDPTRVRCEGNPVRPEMTEGDRADQQAGLASQQAGLARARRSFGLDPVAPVVAVLGGSQGSRSLNDAILGAAPALAGVGAQVVHLLGAGNDRGAAVAAYAAAGVKARVEEYCDRMGELYAATDLAVCRAGGTTIAELTAVGVPAVLVPYPHAAEDHQRANARALAARGAAVVVEEREITPESLGEVLRGILGDRSKLVSMQAAARSAGRPGAARRLADEVRRLASSRNRAR